jgi:hypothetical protein
MAKKVLDGPKLPYNPRSRADRRGHSGPGKQHRKRRAWWQRPGDIITDGRRTGRTGT